MLAVRPELAAASEDRSPEEAARAELPPARRASALIRAVQTADLELVKALVEAGALVNELCQCAGSGSALWTASVAGDADIVEFLLQQGADPNLAAFAGTTPLQVPSSEAITSWPVCFSPPAPTRTRATTTGGPRPTGRTDAACRPPKTPIWSLPASAPSTCSRLSAGGESCIRHRRSASAR